MVSDDEFVKAYADASGDSFVKNLYRPDVLAGFRAIEATHIAKQSGPETVPFDYSLWSKGGWVAINKNGYDVSEICQCCEYTMRKSA